MNKTALRAFKKAIEKYCGSSTPVEVSRLPSSKLRADGFSKKEIRYLRKLEELKIQKSDHTGKPKITINGQDASNYEEAISSLEERQEELSNLNKQMVVTLLASLSEDYEETIGKCEDQLLEFVPNYKDLSPKEIGEKLFAKLGIDKETLQIISKMSDERRKALINKMFSERENFKGLTFSDKFKDVLEQAGANVSMINDNSIVSATNDGFNIYNKDGTKHIIKNKAPHTIHYENLIEDMFYGLNRQWCENFLQQLIDSENITALEAPKYIIHATHAQIEIIDKLNYDKDRLYFLAFSLFYLAIKKEIKNNLNEDVDFYDFYNHIIKYVPDKIVNKNMQKETLKLMFTLAKYETFGKKAYKISDGLAHSLILTELRGLRTDDVMLPYKTIFIDFPKNIKYQINGNRIEGVYIIECEYNNNRIWHFNFTTTVTSTEGHGLYGYTLILSSGSKFSDIINEKQFNELTNFEGRDELVNWIINVIVYATWADAEVEHIILNNEARKLWNKIQKKPSGPKRSKLSSQFNKLDPKKRILLGKSISIINRNKVEYLTDDEPDEGQKLNVRTLVQGHWRHYWVGKGRRYRERKWIKPHWRGSKDAPISLSTHALVGAGDEQRH